MVSGLVSAFVLKKSKVSWPQLGETGDFLWNVWCNVASRVVERLSALRLTIDHPRSLIRVQQLDASVTA